MEEAVWTPLCFPESPALSEVVVPPAVDFDAQPLNPPLWAAGSAAGLLPQPLNPPGAGGEATGAGWPK